MYSPDALNGTNKNNPIYRSSAVSENDEHQNHHHQHSGDKHEDVDYSISNIQITPTAFMNMCPALLVQIEQGSCSENYDTPTPISSEQSVPRKSVKDITSFGKDKNTEIISSAAAAALSFRLCLF